MSGEMAFGLGVVIAGLLMMGVLVIASFRIIAAIHRQSQEQEAKAAERAEARHGRRR